PDHVRLTRTELERGSGAGRVLPGGRLTTCLITPVPPGPGGPAARCSPRGFAGLPGYRCRLTGPVVTDPRVPHGILSGAGHFSGGAHCSAAASTAAIPSWW